MPFLHVVLAVLSTLGLIMVAESCGSGGSYHLTINSVHTNVPCQVIGNLYMQSTWSTDKTKYSALQFVQGSMAIEGCGGSMTSLPYFPNLQFVHSNQDGYMRLNGCSRGTVAFKGLAIYGCNHIIYMTAGSGVGHANVRYPHFPKLETVNGFYVANNHALQYFDTNIFPHLLRVDGNFYFYRTRYFKIHRFKRLYHIGGTVYSNIDWTKDIDTEKQCNERNNFPENPVILSVSSTIVSKKMLQTCKCNDGYWLNHYILNILHQQQHEPGNNGCTLCTPCLSYVRNCNPSQDAICQIPATITAAPTFITTSPTHKDAVSGTFHGPRWNWNITKFPWLLMDKGYSQEGQNTGFRLWFMPERDLTRGSRLELDLTKGIIEVISSSPPRCYIFANYDWDPDGTYGRMKYNVRGKVTGPKTGERSVDWSKGDVKLDEYNSQKIIFTIPDFGIAQDQVHLLMCEQFDKKGNIAFKVIRNHGCELGEKRSVDLTSYDIKGNKLDFSDKVYLPCW